MNKMKSGICLAILLLFLAQPTYAGCKTDCLDKYNIAKEDCNNRHEAPNDADDLRVCLEDAKADYDDCIQECEN